MFIHVPSSSVSNHDNRHNCCQHTPYYPRPGGMPACQYTSSDRTSCKPIFFLYFFLFHIPSYSFIFRHIPSYSLIFLHGPSWSFITLHNPSWFFMVLHMTSYSFMVFHMISYVFFLCFWLCSVMGIGGSGVWGSRLTQNIVPIDTFYKHKPSNLVPIWCWPGCPTCLLS